MPGPLAVPIDAALVLALLREQFPQWADHPVTPADLDGWDNRTFRVGNELSARLPSAEGYTAQVAKEDRWLPVLAPALPVPVPEVLAVGRPGCGYPWPWSLRRWLPGHPTNFAAGTAGAAGAAATLAGGAVGAVARDIDVVTLAGDLADFLTALQTVETTGGPVAGQHSWGRGGPLGSFDDDVRRAVAQLSGTGAHSGVPGAGLDARAVLDVWDAALGSPFAGTPVWVHGDVTGSNLLVDGERLAAVIDFGCCAVGDPACDLAVAWTCLSGAARGQYRSRLGLGADAWARGRGWALWKALMTALEPRESEVVHRFGWRCASLEVVADLVSDHASQG